MALAYDADRVTRDVDARFVPHGIVVDEARQVANDLGLPPWWLNEQATAYISGKDDPGKRRVFDHPGLRVMAASPEHVLAMKAQASRTRDIDDLRLLAGMIGIETPEAALQVCADFYPDEPIPPGPTHCCGNYSADRNVVNGCPSPMFPGSDAASTNGTAGRETMVPTLPRWLRGR